MKYSLLILLACAVAGFGQPVEGPFIVIESDSAIHHIHVAARNDSVADVFYQVGNAAYHVAFALDIGVVYAGPDALPMRSASDARMLCDVTSTTVGWAALTYDSSSGWNRTMAYSGSDNPDSGMMLDSGIVMSSGEWVSISQNYALRLSSRTSGGFFAAWLNEWAYDRPWFWGEAGAGPVVHEFSPGGVHRCAQNGYEGPFQNESQSVDVFEWSPDTSLVLISEPDGITISAAPWGEFGCGYVSSLNWLWRGVRNVGSLFTSSGTIFVVSRSVGSSQACILRIDDFSSYTQLDTLDSEPIVAASNLSFGFAWLSQPSSGLLLNRADTTGTLVHPAGVVCWPDEGMAITGSNIAISDNGKIVIVWTTQAIANPESTQLWIEAVDWLTPLSVSPQPEVVGSPSDFALSAYPNPFNSELQIAYDLPRAQTIELAVYNVLGQKVAELVNGVQTVGNHQAMWSAHEGSGIYFVTLRTGETTKTQKVLLAR